MQGVYVVEKDAHGKQRAKFVPVTTGITGATDIEVLTGLHEGQEIVTGPYKTLRALKDGALLEDATPIDAGYAGINDLRSAERAGAQVERSVPQDAAGTGRKG